MREYDETLKRILTRPSARILADLTGFSVANWHNVDLPAVRHRRADLLGETVREALVHIELQSTNQAHMARRMLEIRSPSTANSAASPTRWCSTWETLPCE